MAQELGQEQADRQLRRFVEQRGVGGEDAGIAQLLQLCLWAHVGLGHEQGERLEILLLQFAVDSLRHRHDKRQPAVLASEHIDDHLRLAIFYAVEHYCLGFRQHCCKNT